MCNVCHPTYQGSFVTFYTTCKSWNGTAYFVASKSISVLHFKIGKGDDGLPVRTHSFHVLLCCLLKRVSQSLREEYTHWVSTSYWCNTSKQHMNLKAHFGMRRLCGYDLGLWKDAAEIGPRIWTIIFLRQDNDGCQCQSHGCQSRHLHVLSPNESLCSVSFLILCSSICCFLLLRLVTLQAMDSS